MSDETGGEDRPLWQLSRDEQRILWITFAGGLFAIVIGAALIGVSFAFARYERSIHRSWWEIVTIFAIPVVFVVLLHWRHSLGSERVVLAGWIVAFLMWSTLIMWLVGLAAGIH